MALPLIINQPLSELKKLMKKILVVLSKQFNIQSKVRNDCWSFKIKNLNHLN